MQLPLKRNSYITNHKEFNGFDGTSIRTIRANRTVQNFNYSLIEIELWFKQEMIAKGNEEEVREAKKKQFDF